MVRVFPKSTNQPNEMALFGHDPFNQNFWAEIQKFRGIEWIVAGSIPLAKRVSRLFKMEVLDHCCSY